MSLQEADLERFLDRVHKAHVLVVGDAMLDHTIWGKVDKSPDLPEFRWRVAVEKEAFGAGGAANAAENIRALGAQVTFAYFGGQDPIARTLKDIMGDWAFDVGDQRRRTTVKQRLIETNGTNPDYLGRVDFEDILEADETEADLMRQFLRGCGEEDTVTGGRVVYRRINAILIEDYAKGMMSESMIAVIRDYASKQGIPVIVDPNRKVVRKGYDSVDVFKPNRAEAGLYVETPKNTASQIAEELYQRFSYNHVVLTDGKAGMIVASPNQDTVHIPSIDLQGRVVNTVGAGDTVAAVLSIGRALGIDIVTIARIANVAAAKAITQQKVCGRLTPESLRDAYQEFKGHNL